VYLLVLMFRIYFLLGLLLILGVVIQGAILNDQSETPLSILVDTIWWQNNRGRGIDRIMKLGRESGLSLDIQNDQGWAPLHFSVEYNVSKVVEALLASGADPNIQENDGWTPLCFAGFHGNKEVMDLLLRFSADASIGTKDQRLPYQLATSRGHSAEAEILSRQAFSRFVDQSDVEKMLRIMQDFPGVFPVNAMLGARGQTPLTLAIKKRDLESAAGLIALGAVPGYADLRTGLTPLHHAVQLGDIGSVRLLLDSPNGAVNVAATNNEGLSPLMLAELLVTDSTIRQSDVRLENMEREAGDSGIVDVGTRKAVLAELQRTAGVPTEEDKIAQAARDAKLAAETKIAAEKAKAKSWLNP